MRTETVTSPTTKKTLRPRLGVALHLIASPDNVDAPEALRQLVTLAVSDTSLDFVELAPVADDELRAELAHLLRLAGVEVIFNVGPVIWRDELDFASESRELRAVALARTAEGIAQAHEFGSPIVQISPGPDHSDRELALAKTADAMRTLCDEAGEMSVALELYDRDNFARRLLGPASEGAAFVGSVDRPNFGLLLDTSHVLLQGDDPAEAVALLGEHVLHVHLANCVIAAHEARAGDQHPYFGLPDGAVGADMAQAFVAALARDGYFDDPRRARIGAEVKRAPGEDPAALLFNSCRFVRQAAETIA